jgi:restriction endonuclease S subunit
MNDGWVETTLGEVAEIRMGLQLSPTRSAGSRQRKYLRAANVSPRAIDILDVNEMSFEANEEIRYAIHEGDVLLVEGGNEKSLGSPALVTAREAGLCIQNTLVRLRVKDPALVLPEYLYLSQLGLFEEGYFARLGKGTTILHLGATRLPPVRILVPPLPVQRRIVDLMTHLDSHLANMRAEQEALRQLLQASSERHFDCVPLEQWVSLGEVADIAMGPFGSSIKVETFVKSGVPVVIGRHLGDFYVSDSNFKFITEEHASRLGRALVYPGDIVITHRGTLGQVSVVRQDSTYPKYCVSQSQFKVSTDRSVLEPEFCAEYLLSPQGQAALLSAKGGTGIPAITKATTHAKALKVPLPPKEIQKNVVGDLRSLRNHATKVQLELATLLVARASLLGSLLGGITTINDDYDLLLEVA